MKTNLIYEEDKKLTRKNDLLFQALEYTRHLINRSGVGDWKDADDLLFSNLDITKQELKEIYRDKGVMVYGASCRDDEEDKKDAR